MAKVKTSPWLVGYFDRAKQSWALARIGGRVMVTAHSREIHARGFRKALVRLSVPSALGLMVSASWAAGFDCPPVKPSTSKAPRYQLVAGQARCEGFYERTVSQTFLELLSLTRGAPGIGAASVLLIEGSKTEPLYLHIQPRQSTPFYRVDARIETGAAYEWDSSQMEKSTGVRVGDLAFLASIDRAPSTRPLPLFTPVLVRPREGSPAMERRLNAVVRVSVPVKSVAWRRLQGGVTESAWTTLPNSRLYEWQRVSIAFEPPAPGADVRIDVEAVSLEDGKALPMLSFGVRESP